MTEINLDTLSVLELENLKNEIDGTVKQKRNDELFALREQVDALINQSPFSLEEVLEAKKLRAPVPPKYCNPDDASQTWTGRGRRPRWVEECLEGGKALKDLAI